MFTCPRCGKTSHNENDLEHGYCAACNEFFIDPLCNEPMQKGEDLRPMNGRGQGVHSECLLRSALGSIEHLEMGPHTVGACHENDRGLTYRQNALLVAEWVRKNGYPGGNEDEAAYRA